MEQDGCYLKWWFSQVLQAGVFTSNAGVAQASKYCGGGGGLSLPNISGQGGWQDLFHTYKQCKYLIFKWVGWGGDIDIHKNLINQV